MNIKSIHPPVTLRNIPEGINKRLSELSSSKEIFDAAAPEYQKALDESVYTYKLHYAQPQATSNKRNRKRKMIWYNPPYNDNVKTNVGKEFLKIIDQCFPPSNKLHKVLNRNTVKLSCSCMPNVAVIIEGENKRKLNSRNTPKKGGKCNCPRNKVYCLNDECLSQNVIYQATVTSGTNVETYVDLTASTLKELDSEITRLHLIRK